jgi:hypothetical protein
VRRYRFSLEKGYTEASERVVRKEEAIERGETRLSLVFCEAIL